MATISQQSAAVSRAEEFKTVSLYRALPQLQATAALPNIIAAFLGRTAPLELPSSAVSRLPWSFVGSADDPAEQFETHKAALDNSDGGPVPLSPSCILLGSIEAEVPLVGDCAEFVLCSTSSSSSRRLFATTRPIPCSVSLARAGVSGGTETIVIDTHCAPQRPSVSRVCSPHVEAIESEVPSEEAFQCADDLSALKAASPMAAPETADPPLSILDISGRLGLSVVERSVGKVTSRATMVVSESDVPLIRLVSVDPGDFGIAVERQCVPDDGCLVPLARSLGSFATVSVESDLCLSESPVQLAVVPSVAARHEPDGAVPLALSFDWAASSRSRLFPQTLPLLELRLRPYWSTDRILNLKESLAPSPDFVQAHSAEQVYEGASFELPRSSEEPEIRPPPSSTVRFLDAPPCERQPQPQPRPRQQQRQQKQKIPPTAQVGRPAVEDSLEEFMRIRGKVPLPSADSSGDCSVAAAVAAFSKCTLSIPSLFVTFLPFHVALASAAVPANAFILVDAQVPVLPTVAVLFHTFMSVMRTSRSALRVLCVADSHGVVSLVSSFFSSFFSIVGDPGAASRTLFLSSDEDALADRSVLSTIGLVVFFPESPLSGSRCVSVARDILSVGAPRVVVVSSDIPTSACIRELSSCFALSRAVGRSSSDTDVRPFLSASTENRPFVIPPQLSDPLRALASLSSTEVSCSAADALLSWGPSAAVDCLRKASASECAGVVWAADKLIRASDEIDAGLFPSDPPLASFISGSLSSVLLNQQSFAVGKKALVVVPSPESAEMLCSSPALANFRVAPSAFVRGVVGECGDGRSLECLRSGWAKALRDYDVLLLPPDALDWSLPWQSFCAVVECCSALTSSGSTAAHDGTFVLRECAFLFQVPRIVRAVSPTLLPSQPQQRASPSDSMAHWCAYYRNVSCGRTLLTSPSAPSLLDPIAFSVLLSAPPLPPLVYSSLPSSSLALALVPRTATGVPAYGTTSDPSAIVVCSERFISESSGSFAAALSSRGVAVCCRVSFEPSMRIAATGPSSCVLLWSAADADSSVSLPDVVAALMSSPMQFTKCLLVLESRLPVTAAFAASLVCCLAPRDGLGIRFSSSVAQTAEFVASSAAGYEGSSAVVLEDEGPSESFLVRVGMNPFSAQVALGECTIAELLSLPLLSLRQRLDGKLPREAVDEFFSATSAEAPLQQLPPPRQKTRHTATGPTTTPPVRAEPLDALLDSIEVGAREQRPAPTGTLAWELPSGNCRGQSQLAVMSSRPQTSTPAKQKKRQSTVPEFATPSRKKMPPSAKVTPKHTPNASSILRHGMMKDELIRSLSGFFFSGDDGDDDGDLCSAAPCQKRRNGQRHK